MLKPGKYEILTLPPYREWVDSLDWKIQQRVLLRVDRMRKGQFGDCKSIASGLYELRMFFGSGYRVYFGEHDGKTVIILAGGDKSTQSRDIKKAKEYWRMHLESLP
jgi:putative addiction module killer protein